MRLSTSFIPALSRRMSPQSTVQGIALISAVVGLSTAAPRLAQAQTYTFKTLVDFNRANGSPADPVGDIALGPDGNLYGVTQIGGTSGGGAVFKIALATNTLTTVLSFTNGSNTSGFSPLAGVTLDASGNIYGTTSVGGTGDQDSGGYGTVYKIAAGTTTQTVLGTFSNANAHNPASSLLIDSQGNLYGTAQAGDGGFGEVFREAAGGGAPTAVATFNNTNGALPMGNVIFDSNGNMYSTTSVGGANGNGTVFEIAAGTNTAITLATFNGTNGSQSEAGLVFDSSGNLYGTTSRGGANNDGTVFKVAAGTHALTTVATFNGANGQQPTGGLTIDAAGDLFGTTTMTSTGTGNVFEIAAGTSTVTTLASFPASDGSSPQSALAMDSHGNLYGTTSNAGAGGYGTVFELSPVGSASAPEPGAIVLLLSGIGSVGSAFARKRASCRVKDASATENDEAV